MLGLYCIETLGNLTEEKMLHVEEIGIIDGQRVDRGKQTLRRSP